MSIQREIADRQEIQRRLDLFPQLVEALRDLVAMIDAVTPHLSSLAVMAHIHGASYNGPQIDVAPAKAVLAQAERQES